MTPVYSMLESKSFPLLEIKPNVFYLNKLIGGHPSDFIGIARLREVYFADH